MVNIRVIHGDCLIELPKLAASGERFHAVVTDPPYGLEFMGREWDGADGFRRSLNEADAGRDSVHGRTSRRSPEYRATPLFQHWCEAWARAVYDALLPGAYLFAFGGTRTSHRLVCAIEDAGFEIRDTICWLYGSGFPKSLDVAKAIDKAARGVPQGGSDPTSPHHGSYKTSVTEGTRHEGDAGQGYGAGPGQFMATSNNNAIEHPPPVSLLVQEAREWQGWGTALKPAYEPIIVARKPLDGTVAANVLKHGCGALNIDASRVQTEESPMDRSDEPSRHLRYNDSGSTDFAAAPGLRRGRPLREARRNEQSDLDRVAYGQGLAGSKAVGETTLGRFPANVIHDGSEEVLAAFPDAPGQLAFVGEKHGQRDSVNCYGDYGARPDTSPRIETDKSASRFFYTAKADKADRADSRHPTVKPVDLIRWLVTLACPSGGHVLDCFAGSGTTGEACMLAGFDCTLIEREAQHAQDIEHRIKRWSGLDAPLFR